MVITDMLCLPAEEAQHAPDAAEFRVQSSPTRPQEGADAIRLLCQLSMIDNGVGVDHQEHPDARDTGTRAHVREGIMIH